MKILVIRFSSIGDIVLCSPVIRLLKSRENVELHFLCKSRYQDILAYNPDIDKLHQFDNSFKSMIQSLKKEKFDLIIDLHNNLRTLRIKRALRVKSYSFFKANIEKWLMVNFKINRLPQNHIVDRYLETLSTLQINNDGKGLNHFYRIDPDLLEELGLEEKYIVFALGAAHVTKQIPLAVLENIIDGLEMQRIVLIGGNDVEEEAKKLKNKFPQLLNLCGQLDLHASSQLIDHSSCVVSGDTGMMHIAAALKKNIVSVWGNTIPSFGMTPYYGNHKIKYYVFEVDLKCRPCSKTGFQTCPKKHFDCMLKQDVSSIIQAIRTFSG